MTKNPAVYQLMIYGGDVDLHAENVVTIILRDGSRQISELHGVAVGVAEVEGFRARRDGRLPWLMLNIKY